MSGPATPFSSMLVRLGRCAALCAVVFALFGAIPSQGMTDLYQLAQRAKGVPTDMTGSTQIYGPGVSYTSGTSLYNIGFTFYFDKSPYTTFSVNTSGLMSLGKATYYVPYSYYWPNYTGLSSYYPLITAYWAYYAAPKATTGKVHYKLTGTAPNRVLTVEWKDVYNYNGTSTSYSGGTWQVRLFEGSNAIEFWYGDFYTGASSYPFNIGIAQSGTRYINVYGNNVVTQHYLYPSGAYSFYRYPQSYPIPSGTIFEFAPCDRELRGLVGNPTEGGTKGMEEGDDLLVGKEVMRGNTVDYRPFSFDLPPSPCGKWTYKVAFSGPAAGDYSMSPGSGTVLTDGLTPTLNFTPQGVGERNATMTIAVSNGETFTYNLNAKGVSRMDRIGNVPEGGTTGMLDGDELLTNIDVPRGSSRDLHPFRITNINTAPTFKGLANANVTFTLDDPYNQYSMRLETSSTSGSSEKGSAVQAVTTQAVVLSPGMTVTPVITFAPTPEGSERGTGPQEATLTVNADGEIFVYKLNGFSVASAAEFFFNTDRVLSSNHRFFVNESTCVGEQAVAAQFVIENPNKVPMTIYSIDVLMTENIVRQGTAPYPQMLDPYGQLVPINDYFVSESASVAPATANARVQFPLTIQPGERKNYYLGFVAQRPGRRFARIFLHTDAVNFVGKDAEGYLPGTINSPYELEEGILVLDLFGNGQGGKLAKDQEGSLNGLALLFNPVRVAQSTTSEVVLYNSGDCDMRISKEDIRLVAGDVDEFELLDILPNTTVDAAGNFVLPPGASDKITARFTPSRSGSRRASVMLKTNDSTLVIDGISDRGIYSLDLFGVGKSFMEARSVRLAPAVIDGPGSTGTVEVFNASTESVMITAAELTGPGIAEITPDPARPWPTLPLIVHPGETVKFGVVLNAAPGGLPGPRDAVLELTLKEGDKVSAAIMGIVGTRSLLANPSSMFRTAIVPVGGLKREYAVLTNVGTFPVRLDRVSVIGTGAADYKLTFLGRVDLDPGESHFIEVTYSPTVTGTSSAQIEIMTNATGGPQYIDLAGTSTSSSSIGGESSNGSAQTPGAGASRAVAGQGAVIASVVPNPAREKATISYVLASEGVAEVALYDLSGRLVRTLQNGYESAGERTMQIDLADLAGGTYYVTIRQNGQMARQSIVVVR